MAQELPEDDPEAVDVAAFVGLTAHADGLLRAHVGRSSHHSPFAGQVRAEVETTRQAEVDESRPPMIIDDDVGRLDVSVDDAHPMRMVERIGQVADNPGGGRCIHPLAVAIPPERSTADQLVCHPASPFVESRVIDGGDIGVVETRHRAGLPEEPFHDPIARVRLLEYLDRHVAIEPGIVGQKHLAESAVSQRSRSWNRPSEPRLPRSHAPHQSIVSRISVIGESAGLRGPGSPDSFVPNRPV